MRQTAGLNPASSREECGRAAHPCGSMAPMAKPNYSGEKRRKELEKQRKKAEKKQRKLDNAAAAGNAEPETDTSEQQPAVPSPS